MGVVRIAVTYARYGLLAGLVVSIRAIASPEFVGTSEDVAIAEAAWDGGVECTGWEAAAHPTVSIQDVDDDSNRGGDAYITSKGLKEISLKVAPEHRTHMMVHEVSHAWVSDRGGAPAAIAEGLTELLVECIGRAQPHLGLEPRDEFRPSDALTIDLIAWDNADDYTDEFNLAGYDGSVRLMRLAAAIVPETSLWPADLTVVQDWSWFWRTIATAVPAGDVHQAALDAAGPSALLLDIDGDSLPTGTELEVGLDPWKWDTDGDGWYDGAVPVEDATPIPLTGERVCMGVRAKRRDASVIVTVDGPMASTVEIYVGVDGGPLGVPGAEVEVPGGEAVLVWAKATPAGAASGGIWATVAGHGLRRDTNCAR